MTGTLLTYWALPLAAAALPWRVGLRLLKTAARCGVRLPQEDEAWSQWVAWRDRLPRVKASAPPDEREWRMRWRLIHLIDHTDLFLVTSRSHRWLDRHARVSGRWPRSGPFLAVTAHWGAGLWALRHLNRSGHRARFLSARFDDESFAGDRARIRYAHARVHAIERIARAPIVYTGGASSEIAQAWAAGVSVIALCDVAPRAGSTGLAASVGRATLTMPRGLLRMAVDAAIPVVTFRSGIDPGDGIRRIDIDEARVWSDERELANRLGSEIATLLEIDAAAWHMWPYATQLLSEAADARERIAT